MEEFTLWSHDHDCGSTISSESVQMFIFKDLQKLPGVCRRQKQSYDGWMLQQLR